jgi:HEAT repeat protein
VQDNEPTLPESLDEVLLRAGFKSNGALDERILESLSAENPRHRVLALRAGVRRGLLTADDMSTGLADSNIDVRRETLTLLAHEKIESVELLEAVRACLDDEDALVVDGAIFALGEHLYVPAVERLCEIALGHDDARCRESAVAALGEIGDERGRRAVLAALDDKPPVRRRAIVALTNFEGPDIDEALRKASEDRDWQVRAAVDQLTRDEPD